MARSARSTPATQQDVADAAGVSRGLVSLALKGEGRMSEETRRRVLDAAHALGYRTNAAAAELAARRSHRVAIIVPYLDNPFFDRLLRALRRRARQSGYTLVAFLSDLEDQAEHSTVDDVLSLRPAGLILPGTTLRVDELVDLNRLVPLCVVDRTLPRESGVPTVRLDEAHAARLTVTHLREQGYQRLAFFSPARARREPLVLERLEANRAEAARQGLALTEVSADGGVRDALAAAAGEGSGPLGVIAYNDLLAIDVVAAGLALGIAVPEDLGVSSYDDSALAERSELRVTSVNQHPEQLMAYALSAALGPEDAPADRTVPAGLVPRGSTMRRG
ncbi:MULTISPECIES: LacI family DNA-binding transcriptional regulator [unclassified Actinomyces]|uniref:LacI family DNA-binding transcriptional regulator n=1 Tax=unclassified Actinomyces TaxID=2609248 RepID=UPI0020172B78|nr:MULTISPECIES: LacI family DNA-binding transcriptional regulator [unclassified Actinomyces]MCL3777615.1 LacI family DNA-binding transcriptional regulator [Actinomyces sp. AC-20-1]MCL3789435.1 LacI family DNA-binding transcriptional regulator [Actinomyces sp. 187325]MCL3791185.1 LacI family DNA-binding transcriptional regulator [Actinomyces sp. 186855]MCL3794421.1 LacI family DNA-binding transcriptional regulator [Actinomyces sp. 217892]